MKQYSFTIATVLLIVLPFIACSKKESVENPVWEKVSTFPSYLGWPSGIMTDKSGTLFICIGPDKELNYDIAMGGGVNVIDYTGIYKSTDDGKTWAPFSFGVQKSLRLLKMTSDKEGTLYVTTNPAGAYRLTNGSMQWTPVSDKEIASLSVGAKNELYLGTVRKGLFRSTDHGDTWEEITGNLPSCTVFSLASDSAGTMVLMTGFSGGFRSTNSGKTWDSIKTRLFHYSGLQSGGVITDGSSFIAYGIGRMERSIDKGATWQYLARFPAYSFLDAGDQTYYGGMVTNGVIRVIKDSTNRKQYSSGIDTTLRVTSIGRSSAGAIYAGTGRGIFRLIRP
jgi:hypothetical protein